MQLLVYLCFHTCASPCRMISTGQSSGRTQPCLTRWWFSSARLSVSCSRGEYFCCRPWTEKGKRKGKTDIKWRLGRKWKLSPPCKSKKKKKKNERTLRLRDGKTESREVIGNSVSEIELWNDNWRFLQYGAGCVSSLYIWCERLSQSRSSSTHQEISPWTIPGLTFTRWLIHPFMNRINA